MDAGGDRELAVIREEAKQASFNENEELYSAINKGLRSMVMPK